MTSHAERFALPAALAAALAIGCTDPVRPIRDAAPSLPVSAAYVAGTYQVLDLGAVGIESYAAAINNPARGTTFGTVVGGTDRCSSTPGCGTWTGFRWTQARGAELLPHATPTGQWTGAVAINDANEIVGAISVYEINPNATQHAAKWTGSIRSAPTPAIDLGIVAGDSLSAAVSINNAGVAVGYSAPPSGPATGVYWPKGATAPRPVPGAEITAWDINDQNELVGYSVGNGVTHAAYFDAATRTLVDIEQGWGLGGGQSLATAISNNAKGANYVVGWAYTASGDQHAFIWTAPAGPMVDLGAATGGAFSWAYDVNSSGQAVGGSSDCGAIRWTVSGGTVTAALLGSIAAPNSCTPGSAARGINDLGQIVGQSPATNAPDAPTRATLWY